MSDVSKEKKCSKLYRKGSIENLICEYSEEFVPALSTRMRDMDQKNIPGELSPSQCESLPSQCESLPSQCESLPSQCESPPSQGASSSEIDSVLEDSPKKKEELDRLRTKQEEYKLEVSTLAEEAGTDEEEDEQEQEQEEVRMEEDNIPEPTVHISCGEKGLLHAEDYVKIKKNFDFLCDELHPEDIISPLFSKGIFTENNVEELEANLKTGDLRACNKRLLFTLFRCGSRAYCLFLECLEEQKYFPAYLQLEPKSNIQICENDLCRGRMPKEHYVKIQFNMEYLKDQLQPEHLITPLFSYNILAENDVSKLQVTKPRVSCVDSLLFILLRRGHRAYGCFCKCLLKGYLFVLRKLEPNAEYYEYDVEYTDKKYDFKADSSSEGNKEMIKKTGENMAKYIDDKYGEGKTKTGVTDVTKGCVKVTFRVLIRDKSEIKGEDIKAHLESGLKSGFIGPDAVKEEGFTFKHLIESDLDKLIAKIKDENLELKKKKEKLERRIKRRRNNREGNSRKQEGKDEKTSPSKMEVTEPSTSDDMDGNQLPSTSTVIGSEEKSAMEINEPKVSTSGVEMSGAESGLMSTFLSTGTGSKRKKNVPVETFKDVPQNPEQARMQMDERIARGAPQQSPMDKHTGRTVKKDEYSKQEQQVLMGQKGKLVDEIQAKFGVTITFPQHYDNTENFILIAGPTEDVVKASAAIKDFIKAAADEVTETVNLSHKLHPRVLGPRGEGIRKLNEKYGVKCTFPKPGDANKDVIYVRGPKPQVDACITSMSQIIAVKKTSAIKESSASEEETRSIESSGTDDAVA